MENLTKTKAIELHREMWRRISEMSDEEIEEVGCIASKLKYKTIKEMGINPNSVHRYCFCCEYTPVCYLCPIIWTGGFTCCSEEGGEYKEFLDYLRNENLNKAREVAKQISQLPQRK